MGTKLAEGLSNIDEKFYDIWRMSCYIYSDGCEPTSLTVYAFVAFFRLHSPSFKVFKPYFWKTVCLVCLVTDNVLIIIPSFLTRACSYSQIRQSHFYSLNMDYQRTNYLPRPSLEYVFVDMTRPEMAPNVRLLFGVSWNRKEVKIRINVTPDLADGVGGLWTQNYSDSVSIQSD